MKEIPKREEEVKNLVKINRSFLSLRYYLVHLMKFNWTVTETSILVLSATQGSLNETSVIIPPDIRPGYYL